MNSEIRAMYEALNKVDKEIITQLIHRFYENNVEIRRCHLLIERIGRE